MKVLIAGGGGYIGSNIAWYLLKGGHVPVVLDNWSASNYEGIAGIDSISAEANRCRSATTAFEHFKFDAVIFSVAPPPVARPMASKAEQVFPATLGSGVVLSELCAKHGVKRVILLSSGRVYGDTPEEGVSEDAPLRPLDLQARADACNEQVFQAYGEQETFSLTILRLFNVAGAGFGGKYSERHHPERHVIPALLSAQASGKKFVIWGDGLATSDGTAVRDFVHVQDVAEAVRLNLEKPLNKKTDIFNVASHKGYSVKEVIEVVESLTDKEVAFECRPDSALRAACRVGDNTRILKALGWEPRYSLIQDIIASQWEALKQTLAEADSQEDEEAALAESAELFGEIAVKLGFITQDDIKKALAVQKKDIAQGKPHRLIGLVMLEEGMIDNAQLIELLRYYDQGADNV